MSLMSKLSATLVLGSSLFAAQSADVVKFLENTIGKNPNVKELKVTVIDTKPMEKLKGWDAFIIELNGKVKQGPNERPISQRVIYFANDEVITSDLSDLKTGERFSITPSFEAAFYTPANLISGSDKSKHKIAIFSDPLCPFCRRYVPEAVEYMKQYPDEFAVYYYHLPLASLHPAAVALTKAAVAAELKGHKNVVLDMYKVEINSRETDEAKIVEAFNKATGAKISVADLHTEAVEKHSKADQAIAIKLMVNGTPTVFFDGQRDDTKSLYKEVKVK